MPTPNKKLAQQGSWESCLCIIAHPDERVVSFNENFQMEGDEFFTNVNHQISFDDWRDLLIGLDRSRGISFTNVSIYYQPNGLVSIVWYTTKTSFPEFFCYRVGRQLSLTAQRQDLDL